jgi:hypothetical protein
MTQQSAICPNQPASKEMLVSRQCSCRTLTWYKMMKRVEHTEKSDDSQKTVLTKIVSILISIRWHRFH